MTKEITVLTGEGSTEDKGVELHLFHIREYFKKKKYICRPVSMSLEDICLQLRMH